MVELLIFYAGGIVGMLLTSLFSARSYARGRHDGTEATLRSIYRHTSTPEHELRAMLGKPKP